MKEVHQWRKVSKNPECTTIMYVGTVATAVLCEQRDWKYEHCPGCDKADFDLIYLWSIKKLGGDGEQALAMRQAYEEQARKILLQN